MYITVAAAVAHQDESTAPGGAAMDIAGAAEESENGLPPGHGGKKIIRYLIILIFHGSR